MSEKKSYLKKTSPSCVSSVKLPKNFLRDQQREWSINPKPVFTTKKKKGKKRY